MLELRPKHWLVTEELRVNREQLQLTASEQLRLQNKLSELQQELDRTHGENQKLQNAASLQPDYTAIRDRVLERLRMGKQSAAGKAIEAFIKELKQPAKVTQLQPITWESRAENFLSEVAGNE